MKTEIRNKKMNSKCEKEVLGIEGGSKSENDLKRNHHNNIMETPVDKMYKIRLNRMSKYPLKDVKWTDPKNQYENNDLKKHNCGIPTG